MWNFSSRVQLGILAVFFINILLAIGSRLNSRFKKRTLYHSFMALNRASGKSEADWPSQTHDKNYHNFSHVVIGFFSVLEILVKHSSLYNKTHFKNFLLRADFKLKAVGVELFPNPENCYQAHIN